jgi:hypothetical protein
MEEELVEWFFGAEEAFVSTFEDWMWVNGQFFIDGAEILL